MIPFHYVCYWCCITIFIGWWGIHLKKYLFISFFLSTYSPAELLFTDIPCLIYSEGLWIKLVAWTESNFENSKWSWTWNSTLKLSFMVIRSPKEKKKKSKGTLGTFQKPDYSFLYDPFIKLHKVFMKIIEIYAHWNLSIEIYVHWLTTEYIKDVCVYAPGCKKNKSWLHTNTYIEVWWYPWLLE